MKTVPDQVCLYICPANVYRADDNRISVAYEGCLECGSCRIACPHLNIEWRFPTGGEQQRVAIARALGETLAVVMVCGNIAQIPHSLFDPVRPITSKIALEMGYASSDHRALLYAAGLILVILTGTLVASQAFRKSRLTPGQAG